MPVLIIAVLICVCILWWRHQAPRRAYAREHIHPLKEELRKAEQRVSGSKAADALQCSEKENLARGMRKKIADLEHQVQLFDRDFYSEIQQAKQAKSKGYDRLNELSEEISQAYDDLNRAKDDLDRWMRKSKGTFIGNGRKELPKHSIFGQSLNQRDSLKANRDRAYEEVSSLKEAKGKVFRQEIAPAKKQLDDIHADKAALEDLRKQGVHPRSLNTKLQHEKKMLTAVERHIDALRTGQTQEALAAKREVSRIKADIKAKWDEFRMQKKSAA